MTQRTDCSQACFEITLACSSQDDAKRIPLDKKDVAKFGGVPTCLKPLFKAIREQTPNPVLDGATVCVSFVEIGPKACSAPQLLDMLERTAAEVQKNASSLSPRKHSTLHGRAYVPLLRAIAQEHEKSGLQVFLRFGGERHLLPVLKTTDFTEGSSPEDCKKCASFKIIGLVRDDKKGHQLILTQDSLFVRLPPNDSQWAWASIRDVLDEESYLEGLIARAEAGAEWMPGPEAKIVRQEKLAA